VYWHGAAADAIADERGQRGLIAGDVIDALPRALAPFAKLARGPA
jgi:NAD(P)H-hydrate repair Nnr-like enzyme with NAD(P)H-hydrate dehydratase domain